MSVFLGSEDEELIGVGGIDPRAEASVEVGRTGTMPPQAQSAHDRPRRYTVPADAVRAGRDNLIAVRVHSDGGRAGIMGPTL